MVQPKLVLAAANRYESKFLMDGAIKIKEFDITFHDDRGPSHNLFYRDMVTEMAYDICECPFSHYLIAKDRGKPLIGIPIFLTYILPHFGVSVSKKSGIQSPSDLVGKKVATPDFGYNPAAWTKGILSHQYDVPCEAISWLEAKEDFFGISYPRSRRYAIEKISVSHLNPAFRGMQALLEENVVDAVFVNGKGMPPTKNTKKLFDDPYSEIRAYVGMTEAFPINTLLIAKEQVIKNHPELANRLMESYTEASVLYRAEIDSKSEKEYLGLQIDVLQELDLYPVKYGLVSHRNAVRLMIQYCYEQGLIRTLFEPEDLFVAV